MIKTLQIKIVLLLCALIVGSGSAWADKITDYAYIVNGIQYYIGATTGGTDYYLSVDGSSTGTGIAGTAVTDKANATVFTFNGSGTSWTIQFESGNYLSLASSKANGKVNVVENAATFTASNQSSKLRLTIGSYSIQKNNSGTQFGSYGNTQTDIWLEEAVTTPTYTITAQSNNNSFGTVSLSGSVITGSPNSGYRYATPAYSVSPANSATVAQNGNEFTVTPSDNTTVTINFEAIPCYTVTLGDDNSTLTETSAGAGVTLPTRSDVGSYAFAGWTTSNIPTETTTAPSTIITAGAYNPTGNITLYPVYTKAGGGAAAPSAFSVGDTGDYAIVSAEQNGKYYALPVQPTVSNGKITAQEITVSELSGVKFVTTANASGFTWTIAAASYGYTLSDGTNYFYHSNGGTSGTNVAYGNRTDYTWAFTKDGDYITMKGMSSSSSINSRGMLFQGTTIGGYALSNANSSGYYKVMILPISAGSTTYYWSNPVAATVEIPVITVAANPFVISTTATITCATEGASIKYSYDNSTWNDYSSALTITETKTIYAKAVKGQDESTVASVEVTKNLATPTVAVSGDLTLDLDGGTNVSAGTLTAVVTYNNSAVEGATVTWSSSDTDIATIDASTGAVTIKTTGEVTFTATYAGNSDYAEATGTNTVTVIDSKAPIVGTINFGNNGTKINSTSITGEDSNGCDWTVTTVFSGNTSFSQQTNYSQVGSSNTPATSITFSMTLPSAQTITTFEAKFGGFNGTAGDVTLKVGNTTVGMGSLNASNDVTVTNSSSAIGTTLTVTVTNIAKGVKCYYISYSTAEATSVPVTIKAGFPATTFSADCALDFTEISGITAYVITDDNGTASAVTTVPANTGLYIEADATANEARVFNVPVYGGNTFSSTTGNMLNCTVDGTTYKTGEDNKTYYAYGHYTGNDEDKYAFMKVKTTGLTPGAGKALLEIDTPVGGAKELIEINGGATSIDEELRMTDEESAGAIYDLSGRRVIAPTKGLYIVNGKKLMVK